MRHIIMKNENHKLIGHATCFYFKAFILSFFFFNFFYCQIKIMGEKKQQTNFGSREGKAKTNGALL